VSYAKQLTPELMLVVWSAEFVRALNGAQSKSGVAQQHFAEQAAERADRAVEALRLLVDVKFRRAEDDDLGRMTWDNFVGCCRSGELTDDDGHGELATVSRDLEGREQLHVSNVSVYPGDAIDKSYAAPDWATHVVWYSK
jgi:hypothetical protein